MEFTTSDGTVITESRIQKQIVITINVLSKNGECGMLDSWEKEFLEWFLDKKIEKPDIYCYIELYKDITEDELKQLEQLKDYLRL